MRGKLQPLRAVKRIRRFSRRRERAICHDFDEGIEQMKFLATFHTHYGAMRFHKHCQNVYGTATARMKPIPRELSASCGVCVCFEADCAPETAEHEDMDRCYIVAPDGTYMPVVE